jgi:hypothetical protein
MRRTCDWRRWAVQAAQKALIEQALGAELTVARQTMYLIRLFWLREQGAEKK